MNVRERLQALLDGKAIKAENDQPRRLGSHGLLEYLDSYGDWEQAIRYENLTHPGIEFTIYEEPEPTAREKLTKRLNECHSGTMFEKNFEALADYIDERIKEMGK